ncbi:hypothetical protein IM793_18120 [Pedobacter sp. MR2016-19]|uniref:hypothetical protein n=1 Tax=Pedobacter sp. MR2016-19 TaxID=2780089 RepID=UPI00105164FC|nr:hypothetical protein [Pedobacter sp. MR2016-19]MBE5321088.1 hypothetical protein [Pedobacter sp. MR2016-19]
MNYLKLIDLGRKTIGQTLLMCIIALIFTACEGRQTTTLASTKADSLLLPRTYITTDESNRREDWFNTHKLPIINDLTIDDTGDPGMNKLNFNNLFEAIGFLNFLIDNKSYNDQDTITGVRVYFASPTIKQGKCGKLTLIFSPTSNGKHDIKNYYAFRNGKLDEKMLELDTAKAWVNNYQLNIREKLSDSTMDPKDTCKKETKHIWFSKEQIESIVEEMKYQIKTHGDSVEKLGVRFISYTDKDYVFKHFPIVRHHQRMTICFTFINKQGKDVGIEQIDSAEFQKRLDYTIKNKRAGDTFDTGDPTPPPSTGNKAALDVSDQ